MSQNGLYIAQWSRVFEAATEVTKYYFFGGQRLAMKDEDGVKYLLGDHLGSTSLVLDANGTQEGPTLRYYPYGELRYPSDPSTFPTDYRFTGQREESHLGGIYHMGARFYDPYINQFLSPDTIIPQPTNPQSFNRYSYVYNNPCRYTDPSGHCVLACVGDVIVIGGLAALALTGWHYGYGPNADLHRDTFGRNFAGNVETTAEAIGALLSSKDATSSATSAINAAQQSLGGQTASPGGLDPNDPQKQLRDLGAQRVQRVVDSFGDEVVEVNRPATVPGLRSGDIDVVLKGNRFAEVGGYSKSFNPSHFGNQMKFLTEYAKSHEGGQALFFYDAGTPQEILDIAIKWLGKANVLPIP